METRDVPESADKTSPDVTEGTEDEATIIETEEQSEEPQPQQQEKEQQKTITETQPQRVEDTSTTTSEEVAKSSQSARLHACIP